MKFSIELLEKAKQAKTMEELKQLLNEENLYKVNEELDVCLDNLKLKNEELSNDELKQVSGGACYDNGELVISPKSPGCDFWVCKSCGENFKVDLTFSMLNVTCVGKQRVCSNVNCHNPATCDWCRYFLNRDGICVCTNEKNSNKSIL